ncbi:MAG: ankyrin repeat domain-containing protein [Clostridiales bacterium]|nr:ankyrin repeat domain-containing protein [Clostridiales bacterium]
MLQALEDCPYTLFRESICNRDIETMNWLIDNKRVNVNKSWSSGVTPLVLAVLAQNIDVVDILLDKGANTGFQVALLAAQKMGNISMVKVLSKDTKNSGTNIERNLGRLSLKTLDAVDVKTEGKKLYIFNKNSI